MYKYFHIFCIFLLQVLSTRFSENFLINLLGVWAASIFVELYEESSSLYFCFKMKSRNVSLCIRFTSYKTHLWIVVNICFRILDFDFNFESKFISRVIGFHKILFQDFFFYYPHLKCKKLRYSRNEKPFRFFSIV